ncbi:MAG: 50S ribosomal protein L17 [Bdellovibrionales bacterium]|nr:50S ribosomal protein L17 [Bdellovibrionales bacterium]
MRHNRITKTFSRETGHRKAMFRNLVVSLVEHGRIKTTTDKAKQLRKHIEKAITISKEGSLQAHRLLLSRYPNKAAVSSLMKDIGPRFKDRNGGYTRILKIGRRPGDAAEMAIIEFVDYALPEAPKEAKGTDATAKKKTVKKAAPKKAAASKIKTVKKAAKKAKKKASKK